MSTTSDALRLLDHARWSWQDCEFGAPAIDCKRPYGNSDVYTDIAKILEIEPIIPEDDDWYTFTNTQTTRMEQAHAATLAFLPEVVRLGTRALTLKLSGDSE